jgi:hypothetical protein
VTPILPAIEMKNARNLKVFEPIEPDEKEEGQDGNNPSKDGVGDDLGTLSDGLSGYLHLGCSIRIPLFCSPGFSVSFFSTVLKVAPHWAV